MGVEMQCAQQARTLGAPFSSSRKATFAADITEDPAESLEHAALPSLELGTAQRWIHHIQYGVSFMSSQMRVHELPVVLAVMASSIVPPRGLLPKRLH